MTFKTLVAYSVGIFALAQQALQPVAANDADRDALLERLAQVSTLEADFSQQVTDMNGDLVQQLHGRMALARPNYLYWQTDAPDETLMVADGINLWYYNPFVEQVTVYQQAEAVEQSPLLLLLDADATAWANYDVKMADNSFALQPNDQAQSPQSLQLVFAGADLKAPLSRIILDDGQGQMSTIELTDVKLNGAVAKQLFTFKVPAGVDVDDQR
ncbi:outer membrane lipoprotein chaperone LolA [Pseudidiomarina sp. WS423]|uniref:outer membrane lipoprotein chaperone LolA n=1 Tax=Pseudidiomarina sp. WS423 TaxID=3425124 RepID=UPI003D6F695B